MNMLGVFTTIYPDGEMTLSRALLISVVGICVVFIMLGAIALFVKLMGVVFDRLQKNKPADAPTPSAAPPNEKNGAPLPANMSQGTLTLENVSEEEAAIIMAIVSSRSGIPLNHLQFHSIKLLEESA